MSIVESELLVEHRPKVYNDDLRNIIISGYIRETSHGLHIITPIVHIIFFYYYDSFLLFHSVKHHVNLEVIDEGSVINKTRYDSGWSSCLLAESIDNNIWNKFVVHIECISCFQGWFLFGCYFEDTENIEPTSLDQYPPYPYDGISINASVGARKFGGLPCDNIQVPYTTSLGKGFKNGDIISLYFDFDQDKMSVYHQGVYAGFRSLNGNKTVTPFWTISAGKDQKIGILGHPQFLNKLK